MTKPIPDKAEVALEYGQAFISEHLSEPRVSTLTSIRRGFRSAFTVPVRPTCAKSVRMHFHYALFAEILHDLARTVSSVRPAAAWEG